MNMFVAAFLLDNFRTAKDNFKFDRAHESWSQMSLPSEQAAIEMTLEMHLALRTKLKKHSLAG